MIEKPAMTREQMIEILYKAAADGISKLIKNGLAFTVLIGVVLGLSFALQSVIQDNRAQIKEMKAEMKELKAEHSEQLNDLRREIAACDLERRALEVKVAELTVTVRRLKR